MNAKFCDSIENSPLNIYSSYIFSVIGDHHFALAYHKLPPLFKSNISIATFMEHESQLQRAKQR